MVRALVLPGQRRIHLKHEQARRRRIIGSGRYGGPGHRLRRRTPLPDRSGRPHRMPHLSSSRTSPPATAILGLSSSRTTPSCELTATTYSSSDARPALLTGSSIATSAPTTSCSLPCRTSGMELGPVRRVAPPDQPDPDHRPHRLTPTSAKPERRVRPDGSRAHFLAASAAGNTSIGRGPHPGQHSPQGPRSRSISPLTAVPLFLTPAPAGAKRRGAEAARQPASADVSSRRKTTRGGAMSRIRTPRRA